MTTLFEILGNGLALGGLYALFGLGLSLIFGVMRLANIAHGDIAIAGAFVLISLGNLIPIPAIYLLPVVLLLSLIFGYLLQRFLLDRVLSADPMPVLLVTFGLSIIIQNSLVEIYGANNFGIEIGSFKTAAVVIAGQSVGLLPLTIFLIALALFGGIHILLSKTRIGRAIRATSEDGDIVSLFGIDRRHIFAVVMAIATVLAVAAGIALATRASITPFTGAERLLIAFEVVVIGGLGSIWATFLGGIILALVHVIGFYFDPASGLLYGHILLLAVILIRPQGLAGQATTR